MSDKKYNYDEYEAMYDKFTSYEKGLHEQNQKKVQVGIWVNIFLPLVFLIISFITSGSKLIFLVLWIVSLFGIAFYLVYVEYTDYQLQQKLKEFGMLGENEERVLFGQEIIEHGDVVNERMNQLDERIDEEVARLENERDRIAKELEEKRSQKQRGKAVREIVGEAVASKLEEYIEKGLEEEDDE